MGSILMALYDFCGMGNRCASKCSPSMFHTLDTVEIHTPFPTFSIASTLSSLSVLGKRTMLWKPSLPNTTAPPLKAHHNLPRLSRVSRLGWHPVIVVMGCLVTRPSGFTSVTISSLKQSIHILPDSSLMTLFTKLLFS